MLAFKGPFTVVRLAWPSIYAAKASQVLEANFP